MERGERSVKEVGHCVIHYINPCKIEEVSEDQDLKKLQFDLIFSENTIYGLTDPLGTVSQLYNFLRPRTGLLFMDDFFFWVQGQDKIEVDCFGDLRGINIAKLLSAIRVPFLMRRACRNNYNYDYHHFIVSRKDEAPCQLPLSYLSTEESSFLCEGLAEIYGDNKAYFCANDSALGAFKERDDEFFEGKMYGDKDLYDFFPKNVWCNKSQTYEGPVFPQILDQ